MQFSPAPRSWLAVFAMLMLPFAAGAAPAPDDPNVSLFERVSHRYQAVLQGVSFYYYTQADRAQILGELFRAVESDYSLFDIKVKRFQIDWDQVKHDALAREAAIPDSQVESEQAVSNLQFLDRATALVASFQDTHFAAHALVALSPVLLPFKIAKVGDHYLIAAQYRKLMGALAVGVPEFGDIQLGQEVLSIDGVPINEAVKKLEPYLSSSTEAFRENYALAALTQRAFALPERGYAVVAIRNRTGTVSSLKFPWMYRAPSRGDESLYLRSRGFRQYDDLRMTWNEESKKWSVPGIPLDNPGYENGLVPLTEEHKFLAEDGSVVVKHGYVLFRGKAYAVLQINSFSESSVTEEAKAPAKFLDVLREFLKKTEAQGIPLVLDLRDNPGGNASYPASLLSMLSEKGKSYPDLTQSFRVTRNIQEIVDQGNGAEAKGEVMGGLSQEQASLLLADAVRQRELYTSAFSMGGDITADAAVGGFSQKIVALISPNCISACDITAALLKSSGRATLLGQPTNGTGAGYYSEGNTNSQWNDSFRVLSAKVPNFLFGLPGGPAGGELIFPGQAEALSLENRPTAPDVLYENAPIDLFEGSPGWVGTAIGLLEKK